MTVCWSQLAMMFRTPSTDESSSSMAKSSSTSLSPPSLDMLRASRWTSWYSALIDASLRGRREEARYPRNRETSSGTFT